MFPKKKRVRSKTSWKREADALQSKVVRLVGRCDRCFKTASNVQLQDAHVITRSNLHLRYDPQNHMCLCASCHRLWHSEPLLMIGWFKDNYPERAAYLEKERNVIEHTLDYEAIVARISQLLSPRE